MFFFRSIHWEPDRPFKRDSGCQLPWPHTPEGLEPLSVLTSTDDTSQQLFLQDRLRTEHPGHLTATSLVQPAPSLAWTLQELPPWSAGLQPPRRALLSHKPPCCSKPFSGSVSHGGLKSRVLVVACKVPGDSSPAPTLTSATRLCPAPFCPAAGASLFWAPCLRSFLPQGLCLAVAFEGTTFLQRLHDRFLSFPRDLLKCYRVGFHALPSLPPARRSLS